MKKICSFCGNRNFKKQDVTYIYRHDEKFLLVDNVPCEECEYCGEQYFQASVLKKIECDFNQIYISGKRAGKTISLPVEEFSEIGD